MLYGAELTGDTSVGHARLVLNLFNHRFDQSIEDYALHLVHGVLARREELDALVRENARNWKYTRMAIVDRQIMRIALWEMRYDRNMPAPVCINEAIDIAKLFSTSESGHFINGILDNVHKHAKAPAGAAAAVPAGAGRERSRT